MNRMADKPRKLFAPLFPRWRPLDKGGDPTNMDVSLPKPPTYIKKIKLPPLRNARQGLKKCIISMDY